MLMDLTSYKIVENLIKMAEKLSRYQVFIVLEKPTFPSNNSVSHNGTLNALSGRMLTRLMM